MDYSQPPTAAAMPLLTFDHHVNDAGEFDYSAFLQDLQDTEDVDYLAEESSGSTGEPRLTPASSSSWTLPDPALQLLAPRQVPSLALCPPSALEAHSRGSSGRDSSTSPGGQGQGQGNSLAHAKQRLERRGHTKSRRGCFNCKRRRIKVWGCGVKSDWKTDMIDSARRRGRRADTAPSRASSASTRRRRPSCISPSTKCRSSASRICASSSTSCSTAIRTTRSGPKTSGRTRFRVCPKRHAMPSLFPLLLPQTNSPYPSSTNTLCTPS